MRLLDRIAVGALGLVAVAYCAANFTGAIRPPWWTKHAPLTASEAETAWWVKEQPPGFNTIRGHPLSGDASERRDAAIADAPNHREPRPGCELISGAVGAVGLATITLAAWPRRRRTVTP